MVHSSPKTFWGSFRTPLVRTKKILSHPPQKGNFRAAEISAQPISTIFGQKNFFWSFFRDSRGSFIGLLDASWGASIAQKCIIILSKGLRWLPIKFGDHFSKFEEWPNSSNFDKLGLDSISSNKLMYLIVKKGVPKWVFHTLEWGV